MSYKEYVFVNPGNPQYVILPDPNVKRAYDLVITNPDGPNAVQVTYIDLPVHPGTVAKGFTLNRGGELRCIAWHVEATSLGQEVRLTVTYN
jgi:hypothetical protein